MSSSPNTVTETSMISREEIVGNQNKDVMETLRTPEKDGFSSTPPAQIFKGVVTGKFENGYMIQVKKGRMILNGVLYRTQAAASTRANVVIPQEASPGVQQEKDVVIPREAPPVVHLEKNVNIPAEVPPEIHREKKRRLRRLDPQLPKKNLSAYNYYFKEQHAKLKPLHPGKGNELTKMIGESWLKLSQDEKKVYREMEEADRERYRREKEAHLRMKKQELE